MDIKLKDNSKFKLALVTQLEYIESTGTQYIDTGIKADNNNQTFKIGVSFLSNSQYFGSGENGRAQATATIFRNTNTALAINWGSWSSNGSILQSNYPLETLAEIEIKARNVIKLNGSNTSITANDVSFSSGKTANFILNGFSDASNGSVTGNVVRTHYFIVENNGIEIIHLMPVKDKYGVVCLYDTVSETFFYNQGTGDFIAGPKVPTSIASLPNNILLKTTTLYHKNTPNVDGLQLLNSIFYTQETAEDVVLNRIRVDIGNVSGSISELMHYAQFAGFNDAGEEQTKPRLVGTWTINDWYTQEQLTAAQAAFDGLTVVGDTNYLIDFDNIAVQVLDSTKPNYNPAAAIILQAAGYGNTFDNAPISGGGRWFLTKAAASTITGFGTIFNNITSVSDSNNIVSNTTQQYDFTSFREFRWFTGITVLNNGGFTGCTNLTEIGISSNLTTFGTGGGYQVCVFMNCTALNAVYYYGTINDWFKITFNWENYNIMWSNPLYYAKHLYINDQIIENIVIDDTAITQIKKLAFYNNVDVKSITITSPITVINHSAFRGCTGLQSVSFPDELVNVAECAFLDCRALTSIDFNNAQIKTLNTACFGRVPYQFKNTDIQYIETYGKDGYDNPPPIGNFNTTNIEFPNIKTFAVSLYWSGGNCTTEFGPNLTTIICSYLSANSVFHILTETPPTLRPFINGWGYWQGMCYVGDGTSATHDDAILQLYANDSVWSNVYNKGKLDTWYNYLHPTT